MIGMARYYISRVLLSMGSGIFLILTGSQWWLAGLLSLIVLALFLWAPHSGRYAVRPEFGITALRRDERTQTINDKAARNAFVATLLFVAGIIAYSGTIASTSIPVAALQFSLAAGLLTYYGSDFWLRRKQS